MGAEKTYCADPADHDACARALLEKLQDQQDTVVNGWKSVDAELPPQLIDVDVALLDDEGQPTTDTAFWDGAVFRPFYAEDMPLGGVTHWRTRALHPALLEAAA